MIIIHSPSTSPSFNLAAEEVLFSDKQEDLLFLYVNEPSVILGSNQVLRNEVNTEFCKQNNIQIMRRMSGGGTVYHDLGNLNYSFITNSREGKLVLNADFLLPVVAILKALNIPSEIGERKDLWLPGGYKISGTASHIGKKRELHHGTLLYDANLDNLTKCLTVPTIDFSIKGTPSVPSPVKNIRQFLNEQNLPAPPADVFFNVFTNAASVFFNNISISELYSEEIQQTVKLQQNKYNSTEWIYRK